MQFTLQLNRLGVFQTAILKAEEWVLPDNRKYQAYAVRQAMSGKLFVWHVCTYTLGYSAECFLP